MAMWIAPKFMILAMGIMIGLLIAGLGMGVNLGKLSDVTGRTKVAAETFIDPPVTTTTVVPGG